MLKIYLSFHEPELFEVSPLHIPASKLNVNTISNVCIGINVWLKELNEKLLISFFLIYQKMH